ncbi:MAG: BatA and WFA domain-containing protein [Armatimonadia bacterium]
MLFTAPWYLLGALGALVPVLVHLFGRRKARRVLFPSLRLIKAAQRERTSLVRLRQVWLMVLRAAAIVLLSLALARPTLPWVTARGGGDRPLTVVVDDTLSMRTLGPGRTAFEVAKRGAEKLLESMTAGRSVRLAQASGGGEAREMTAREALAAVRGMEAGSGAEGMREALRRAEGEVWVFTDLQWNAWIGGDPGGTPAVRAPGTLTVVDCGREAGNLGVGRVEPLEGRVLKGQLARVEVELTGSDKPKPVRVAMTVGRVALPAAEVAVGGRRALFEWEPDKAGALAVTAKLPPDSLREDDEGYAVAEVREELRVLLVGTEEQTRHVRMALAPEAGGAVKVRVVPEATEAEREWAHVVGVWEGGGVRVGAPSDTGANPERRGTSPRPTVEPGMLVLAEGMAADDVARLAPGVRVGKTAALPYPLRLGWFEVFQGPLRAFGNPAAGDLQAVSFRAVRPLSVVMADQDWEVLARFEDGTPGIVGGEVDGQRRVVVNLALDPARSDLVTQPVFVPLVHRLCKYVARREFWEVDRALVGGTLRLHAPYGAAEVRCADGEGKEVPVEVEGAVWKMRPARPGVHRLSWTEGTARKTALLAVNVDPRESDLRRIGEAELQRLLRPVAVRVVKAEAVREMVGRGPLGIATPLFVMAFLAMVAELLLARRRA